MSIGQRADPPALAPAASAREKKTAGTHPRGELRVEDGLPHGDGVRPGGGDVREVHRAVEQHPFGQFLGPDLADPQLVPVVQARRVHVPVGHEEDALGGRARGEVEDLDGELDGDDGVLRAGVDEGAVAQLALVVPAAGARLAVLVEVVGGLLVRHHLDDIAGGAVRDLFTAIHLDLEGGEGGGPYEHTHAHARASRWRMCQQNVVSTKSPRWWALSH